MRIRNVHERVVTGDTQEIAALMATLGQRDDKLCRGAGWPADRITAAVRTYIEARN